MDFKLPVFPSNIALHHKSFERTTNSLEADVVLVNKENETIKLPIKDKAVVNGKVHSNPNGIFTIQPNSDLCREYVLDNVWKLYKHIVCHHAAYNIDEYRIVCGSYQDKILPSTLILSVNSPTKEEIKNYFKLCDAFLGTLSVILEKKQGVIGVCTEDTEPTTNVGTGLYDKNVSPLSYKRMTSWWLYSSVYVSFILGMSRVIWKAVTYDKDEMNSILKFILNGENIDKILNSKDADKSLEVFLRARAYLRKCCEESYDSPTLAPTLAVAEYLIINNSIEKLEFNAAKGWNLHVSSTAFIIHGETCFGIKKAASGQSGTKLAAQAGIFAIRQFVEKIKDFSPISLWNTTNPLEQILIEFTKKNKEFEENKKKEMVIASNLRVKTLAIIEERHRKSIESIEDVYTKHTEASYNTLITTIVNENKSAKTKET